MSTSSAAIAVDAACRLGLDDIDIDIGKDREALADVTELEKLLDETARRAPKDLELARAQAMAHSRRSYFAAMLGDSPDQGLLPARAAVEASERALALSPGDSTSTDFLVYYLGSLAEIEAGVGELDSAFNRIDRSVELATQLAAAADTRHARVAVPSSLFSLGRLQTIYRPALAEPTLRRAKAEYERALVEPQAVTFEGEYVTTLLLLGESELALRRASVFDTLGLKAEYEVDLMAAELLAGKDDELLARLPGLSESGRSDAWLMASVVWVLRGDFESAARLARELADAKHDVDAAFLTGVVTRRVRDVPGPGAAAVRELVDATRKSPVKFERFVTYAERLEALAKQQRVERK